MGQNQTDSSALPRYKFAGLVPTPTTTEKQSRASCEDNIVRLVDAAWRLMHMLYVMPQRSSAVTPGARIRQRCVRRIHLEPLP